MRRHDKRKNPRSAHVRHILVPDKPSARKIIEDISVAKKPTQDLQETGKTILNLPERVKKRRFGRIHRGTNGKAV